MTKIGDKVRILNIENKKFAGQLGIVIATYGADLYSILLKDTENISNNKVVLAEESFINLSNIEENMNGPIFDSSNLSKQILFNFSIPEGTEKIRISQGDYIVEVTRIFQVKT